MHRRTFLTTILPAAAATSQLTAQPEPQWGGPVLDTHLHIRADADACFTHMQGCGVTHAVLLTPVADQERAKAEMAKRPGHFVRSVRIDPSAPESGKALRDAVKNGVVSVGELKFHLALDSPEMRRVYDIAAELQVPVMMHIQTFPHFDGELPYNTGYPQFHKVLRAYPRTTFIGHGDLFWAHISADVPTDRGYPAGPIKPGGLTDRWLSDFPNLYADMSANSGNNALSRDQDFSRGFINRHKTKLIFGSDCSCADGKGAGISQNKNPEASRLAGKCVARETLGLLQRLASPQVFRAITWENGVKLFKVKV
ncbi:amidohydrolase family protein [uncultured Paludibaculum sp.]|uniref:amidohydrolase family protein n=1 Tax=uncultured Paludibaculum sp. TaxID=1765020 RepID=UPI002AABDA60|nr:amidohydrolase family protein [uncultured Paludibaculum sp.]